MDAYAPIWRLDPMVATIVGNADCALMFDTIVQFTRSNEHQKVEKFKLLDGRYCVQLSRAMFVKMYPWLTKRMVEFRIRDLRNTGLIDQETTENGAYPVFVIASEHYGSCVRNPHENVKGGNENVTPPNENVTHSFSPSVVPSLNLHQEPPNPQPEPESAPAKEVFALAIEDAPPQKLEREDTPCFDNPRYAQHRRIAEAAYEKLARSPGIHHLRVLMRVIDECRAAWSLDDQERLLPRIINEHNATGQPILNLAAFLRFKSMAASAFHPYGRALLAERPEPLPTVDAPTTPQMQEVVSTLAAALAVGGKGQAAPQPPALKSFIPLRTPEQFDEWRAAFFADRNKPAVPRLRVSTADRTGHAAEVLAQATKIREQQDGVTSGGNE